MGNVGFIGWIHTMACMIALATGAVQLVARKGTPTHKTIGRWYFFAMLIANVSVFAIYKFDIRFAPVAVGPGIFGLFHWMAVTTLAALLLGLFAASRQKYAVWAYVHPAAMLFTYYMLVGGLINEAFVRVPFLHDIAQAQIARAANTSQAPIVGQTQFAAMVFFIGLLVWFMVRVARYRRRMRRGGATPLPA
jgi:uncharacterized membrane protein